jgi:hypothetical protein
MPAAGELDDRSWPWTVGIARHRNGAVIDVDLLDDQLAHA